MLIRPPHRPHRAKNPQRHRQIEPRAFLPHIRRRQIDRHRFVRIPEPRIAQRRFDPLPALPHRRVRHPHRHEVPRTPARIHVHFHIDQMRFNTKHSSTTSPEKGHAKELVAAPRYCSLCICVHLRSSAAENVPRILKLKPSPCPPTSSYSSNTPTGRSRSSPHSTAAPSPTPRSTSNAPPSIPIPSPQRRSTSTRPAPA